MVAYFEDLNQKINSLSTLAELGFKDEARILCLVYIDGLAQGLYWPDDRNGMNYVRALCEYSGDAELRLVHPLQLARALDALKPAWHSTAAAIRMAFPGPTYELLDVSSVLNILAGVLTPPQLCSPEPEIWRGTIASVVYYEMRNPAVHHLGAATTSFGSTTVLGQPARRLDLPRLQAAAKRLAAKARDQSLAAGKWFGNALFLS